jgi:hypothetical protein
MRRQLFIAAATVLTAALTGCAMKCKINCTAVLVQLPCGPEKVMNGSFENGPFAPNPSGVMPLPNGAKELSGWTIANKGPSSLLWVGKNGLGLAPQDGQKFINLAGSLPGPIPVVDQMFQLDPGRYLVQFAVGWDGVRNPAGIVKVDWALYPLDSMGNPPNPLPITTVPTHGVSTNHWEPFTSTIQSFGGTWELQFQATSGQILGGPFPFIGLDGVSVKELFPFDSRACLPGTGVPIK